MNIENDWIRDTSATLEILVGELILSEQSQSNEVAKLASLLCTLSDTINSLAIKNEERSKVTKERFNVFSCLTKHHLEELHSNFIYYLLNPNSSHDCGASFLKTFFDLLEATGDFAKLFDRVTPQEFDSATVRKEFPIGRAAYTDVYGFIDIFIETENYIVAIENKIYAVEQSDQIWRYSRFCNTLSLNKGKQPIVLYLTIDGKESAEAGGENYYPISYDRHIRSWLENCIKESWQYPLVYAGLFYYKELLNTSILHKTSNNVIMDIKELLLKKENLIVLKHLPELTAAIVPIRNKLRLDFLFRIFEILKAEGYTACPVHRINNENVSLSDFFKEQYRGIKIKNDDITISIGGQGLIFCIEHDYPELYFGLFGNYKHSESDEHVIHSLRNRLPRYSLGKNEHWACWKVFKINERDFGDDHLNFDFATNMDKIVDDFMLELHQFIAAWKGTIIELGKSEKPLNLQ